MINIFYNILYMSIIASFLAIIILILRKIFDKKISPNWKFSMWILLFISLILPFRFTLESNNSHKFLISSFIDKIVEIKNYLSTNNIGTILVYIWLAGIIILLTIYLINSIIMKKQISKKELQDERLNKILSQAKEKIGVKTNIKLIEQENKKVPCIYGYITPKILLTNEIVKKDDKTILHIFMHELSHYKRKDIIINKILILITIIHWFNPILWFCFKQIRQDMELKADELVVSKLKKDESKEYAKSLVSLLPIANEEKQIPKLLYVTDGKKNMERRIKMIKLSEKFKEYKALIGVTTITLTLCIGLLIFTQIKPKEQENYNNVQYFETPDRIVYKIGKEDKYYVFMPEEDSYKQLTNQLINCINGINEGRTIAKEEIKEIEENESYIELDYNTISKNYIVAFNHQEYNVIKRNNEGEGGVIVNSKIEAKEELINLLKEQTKDRIYYEMENNNLYKFPETIKYNVPSFSNELKKYEQGIYSVKLNNINALNRFLENNNLTYEGNITEETFEKSNVIATITKYDIDKVISRVGGMTYYFKGKEEQENNETKYHIAIYTVSKAVNENCIYRNYEKLEINQLKTVEAIIEKIENDTYYLKSNKNEEFSITLNQNVINKNQNNTQETNDDINNIKIINARTQKEEKLSNIKVNDKLILYEVYDETLEEKERSYITINK